MPPANVTFDQLEATKRDINKHIDDVAIQIAAQVASIVDRVDESNKRFSSQSQQHYDNNGDRVNDISNLRLEAKDMEIRFLRDLAAQKDDLQKQINGAVGRVEREQSERMDKIEATDKNQQSFIDNQKGKNEQYDKKVQNKWTVWLFLGGFAITVLGWILTALGIIGG